ncbi:hypothetical protein [Streptomyces sp. NBC_01689]|uniref:hypothetical protein n=1 Tax=Streptomyces sp. NBC_01689 TaxID=2975911 RepID=UPI0011CDEBE5|nr:hypothetical protein [Streptomyces sp. NBC_01689]TXS71305.1 hypothetical protein EAO69_23165 [Streptomyces sp. me109]
MRAFDPGVTGDANPDGVAGPPSCPPTSGQRDRPAPYAGPVSGGSAAVMVRGAARPGPRDAPTGRAGTGPADALVGDAPARGVDAGFPVTGPEPASALRVVVTPGDGDRAVRTASGTRLPHAPVVPVDPVGTVGAGDGSGVRSGAATPPGTDPASALAVARGPSSTRGHGGTAARPTWDEARAAASDNSHTGSH